MTDEIGRMDRDEFIIQLLSLGIITVEMWLWVDLSFENVTAPFQLYFVGVIALGLMCADWILSLGSSECRRERFAKRRIPLSSVCVANYIMFSFSSMTARSGYGHSTTNRYPVNIDAIVPMAGTATFVVIGISLVWFLYSAIKALTTTNDLHSSQGKKAGKLDFRCSANNPSAGNVIYFAKRKRRHLAIASGAAISFILWLTSIIVTTFITTPLGLPNTTVTNLIWAAASIFIIVATNTHKNPLQQ